MNPTTLKLLFVLGIVSCIILDVNARAVEQPWESDDAFNDYDDGYEREVRQPIKYGKRRTFDTFSDTRNYASKKGPFNPPPYYPYKGSGK
jgi:hypothetical protein